MSRGPYRHRLVEWMLSSYMVLWGIALLLPFETFQGNAYRALAQIAPENVWGVFSFSVGVMRMLALWVNGSHRATPALRMVGAIGGVCWWISLWYMLLLSATWSTLPAGIIAFYPVNIAFELYSAYRTGIDAYDSATFKRLKTYDRVQEGA
jgi:hypothetical protein